MLELIILSLSLVLAVFATVLAARAYALTRLSVPNQLIEAVGDLEDRVIASEASVESQEAKNQKTRSDVAGMLESVEDVLTRVERKRRSTAAAASRIDGQGNGPAPGSMQDLQARAVAQGLLR